jgi:tetratricopeptide (TPR) repeat protein
VPTVFLSYRNESETHTAAVTALADSLRASGVSLTFDVRSSSVSNPAGPPGGWPAWCATQARTHKRVLVVASAGWFDAWNGGAASRNGFGCAAEAPVLRQRIQRAGQNNDFLRLVHLDARPPVTPPQEFASTHAFHWPSQRGDLLHWLGGDPPPGDARGWLPTPPRLPWEDIAGHEHVREALSNLLCASSEDRVLRIHGPSSLGKTAILRQLERVGEAVPGAVAHRIDLRTPRSELDHITAAAVALGAPDPGGDVRARLGALLRSLADTGRAIVLMFDSFECASDEMNAALADGVLDQLGPATRLVVASRERPRAFTGPDVEVGVPDVTTWRAFASTRNPFFQRRPSVTARTRYDEATGRAALAATAAIATPELLGPAVQYLYCLARYGDDRTPPQPQTAMALITGAINLVAPLDAPAIEPALPALALPLEVDEETLAALVDVPPALPLLARLPCIEVSSPTHITVHRAIRPLLLAELRAAEDSPYARWSAALRTRAVGAHAYAEGAWYGLAGSPGTAVAGLWTARRKLATRGDTVGEARLTQLAQQALAQPQPAPVAAALEVLVLAAAIERGEIGGAAERARRCQTSAGDSDTRHEATCLLAAAELAGGRLMEALHQAEASRDRPAALEARGNDPERARDLATTETSVGDACLARQDLDGALAAYTAARELLKRITARAASRWDWHRELSITEGKIANVLLARGELDGALLACTNARDAAQRVTNQQPNRRDFAAELASAEARLGDVLHARGDLAGAVTALTAARDIWRRLAAHDPQRSAWQRELGMAESRVGDILYARGELEGASTAFTTFQVIFQRLVARAPDRREWARELAVADSRVGDIAFDRGEMIAALDSFTTARDRLRKLTEQAPSKREWQRELAVAESKVGAVLLARGDLHGALAAHVAGREIFRRLLAYDPSRRDWLRDLGMAEARVGDVYIAGGEYAGAVDIYGRSRDACRRLLALDPGQREWLKDLAAAEARLGDALVAHGELHDAYASYMRDREICRRLVAEDPNRWDWVFALATAEYRLAALPAPLGASRVRAVAARDGIARAMQLAPGIPHLADDLKRTEQLVRRLS